MYLVAEWYQWVDQFPHHVVLDGGLGSILSERGHDLSVGTMWSGRLLVGNEEELGAVARIWFEAGADLVMTATYQVSTPQLRSEFGLSEPAAKQILGSSVKILSEARAKFWTSQQHISASMERRFPKTGASLGPYYATVPNLDEYTGSYDGVSYEAILGFHKGRCEALESRREEESHRADVYCFETIGNPMEGRAIAEVMSESNREGIPYWISFQCSDAEHIASGAAIGVAIREVLNRCTKRNLVAVGVNCVLLGYTKELVDKVKKVVQTHMSNMSDGSWRVDTVAYPNSGEVWFDGHYVWPKGVPREDDVWAATVENSGARLLGGCCRVGPDKIRALHARR